MLLIHVLLLCLIYCGNSAVAAEMNFDNCEAADVLFLIDKVRTIGLDLMEKEKQLVKNIVSQLPLSSNLTRVAVWSFSKGKKQEFGLDQEQTIDAALKAVDGIVFGPGINRYTHRAIRLANKYLNKHARDGVHRIIVYVTVGPVLDPEESLQSADKARKDGIMLFALGVGNDVDSAELSQLAYKNQEPYLLNNLEATNYLTHNLKDCSETPDPTQSTYLPTTENVGSTSGYDEFDEGTSDTFEDFSTSILPTSSYGGFSETFWPSSSSGDVSESSHGN